MDSTAPWCKQDLFFLDDALRRGSSFAEVAGFLCRHEGEVREKAKELGWCEGLKSLEGQP